MTKPIQETFRPLIAQRLAAVQNQLHAIERGSAQEAALRDSAAKFEQALARIEIGVFGRCIRCGRALPPKRLEQELVALSCDPCPERTKRPVAAGLRRPRFV